MVEVPRNSQLDFLFTHVYVIVHVLISGESFPFIETIAVFVVDVVFEKVPSFSPGLWLGQWDTESVKVGFPFDSVGCKKVCFTFELIPP